MRLALRGASPAEWLALRAGLVPVAAADASGGMALSAVVVAAVRSGITSRLAAGHATAAEVAADLGLDPLPTRLLLDCLRSTGYVAERSGRYRLSRSARRWLRRGAVLQPRSPPGARRLYRFRTRRWCRDLLFALMSWLRQDRGLCPFACST